jgi:hypothetical protein
LVIGTNSVGRRTEKNTHVEGAVIAAENAMCGVFALARQSSTRALLKRTAYRPAPHALPESGCVRCRRFTLGMSRVL